MKRASGILMHISSLPGDFGIGTMGKYAYDFVDFLKRSKQTYWQILPICPTSYGDSPYQSFSTFAGNPYFIDLDMLRDDGFLTEDEYKNISWGNDENTVDYELLYIKRKELFKTVQKHFFENIPSDYEKFCLDNSFWLDDYSLFMAIKDLKNGVSFDKWEDEIRLRKKDAMRAYTEKCIEGIKFYKMLQYLFFNQWNKLKKYANDNNIKIIGDLPIYVAADSADVWANPKLFDLNSDCLPNNVAGCPPDAFSDDGQLWGNPVYNWNYMKRTGFKWWTLRLRESLKVYDVIRIDHFRAFDSYYCIKYGEKTAKNGLWKKGPGIKFFKVLEKKLGKLPLIAEDLGFLTDGVRQLVKDSGYPGMKVLQFAFDSREESDYLPHNYDKNCVVYTGTHDNDTILGWLKSADKDDVKFAKEYLNTENDVCSAMIRAAFSSVADTAVITMQDLLYLDETARMNIPSTVGNNWLWRAEKGSFTTEISDNLAKLTTLYSRNTRRKVNERDRK